MSNANETEMKHSLTADDRRRVILSGVTDAERFDESSVILYTTAGKLVIKGKALSVGELDTESGSMIIEGEISSFVYGDRDRQKTGFFGKLLR